MYQGVINDNEKDFSLVLDSSSKAGPLQYMPRFPQEEKLTLLGFIFTASSRIRYRKFWKKQPSLFLLRRKWICCRPLKWAGMNLIFRLLEWPVPHSAEESSAYFSTSAFITAPMREDKVPAPELLQAILNPPSKM